MVLEEGFEPPTQGSSGPRSTPELLQHFIYIFPLVGVDGLEPSTSVLSGLRSNHLSYTPLLSYMNASKSEVIIRKKHDFVK